MAKLQVRYFGHPDLRLKAKPVEKITPEIIELCESMLETMISFENAIGFAGTQLGVLYRIFVIREEIQQPDGKYTFAAPEVIINPVLSKPSQAHISMIEGCMSIPNVHVEVLRPESIHVRYQNLKGEFIDEELKDFRARMFMHENDHLNGVLIVDRIDPKERKTIEPVLKKIKNSSSSI